MCVGNLQQRRTEISLLSYRHRSTLQSEALSDLTNLSLDNFENREVTGDMKPFTHCVTADEQLRAGTGLIPTSADLYTSLSLYHGILRGRYYLLLKILDSLPFM